MKYFLNRDYLYCDDKMKATRHKKKAACHNGKQPLT